jgi:RNA polymerase sigma-70 factor (ECF subfamily)
MISLDEKEIEITDENYDDSNLSFQILIENLKEEEKTILTMYYCFQYTTKEISNILNINENTVKSKIVRAKEKLKNKFGGEKTWKI